ncbi:SPOR domain-containing protein [Flavobacterium sp.]|uniref:SPOR domain-containing protein n=1 Tax=Flavobacterium sp. TaxID=239 RepID=UPI003F6A4280
MKNIMKLKYLTFLLLFNILSFNCYSQTSEITIEQDDNIETLLKEKRRMNTGITINDLFKIQIFNGNSDNAKKTMMEFKNQFKEIDVTMIYNNPTFKVWAGNFKTRIEAENALLEIKKKYPLALLIKPNK